MKVWVGCWREAAGALAVPALIQVGLRLWDRDLAWGAAIESAAAWAAVGAVWAAVTWLALRLRAHRSGITLAPDALATHQTRRLRVLRPSVGWPDRLRTELGSSDRAFVTAEKGREEIWFHWRPGRRNRTVWGSIAFEETTGTVRLDLRASGAYTGSSGLRQGAAFMALCQVAGELGLAGTED
ncbi:hypothetical protein ACIQPR_16690 [Streptomyces sp. NPDC091280]|uniref:hypothetical protein n=1 Tax=unclassified Streptomyces TaxID=2593676 RepID=UPI0037FF1894